MRKYRNAVAFGAVALCALALGVLALGMPSLSSVLAFFIPFENNFITNFGPMSYRLSCMFIVDPSRNWDDQAWSKIKLKKN